MPYFKGQKNVIPKYIIKYCSPKYKHAQVHASHSMKFFVEDNSCHKQ